MIVLLAQHHEYRIGKLEEFANVVPPASIGHPHGFGTARIVNRLTAQRVVAQPSGHQTLQKTHHIVVVVEKHTYKAMNFA